MTSSSVRRAGILLGLPVAAGGLDVGWRARDSTALGGVCGRQDGRVAELATACVGTDEKVFAVEPGELAGVEPETRVCSMSDVSVFGV